MSSTGKYHNNQMRTVGLDSDEDCPYTPSRDQRKPKKSAPLKRKPMVKTEKSKAGSATPAKRKRGNTSVSAVKEEKNNTVGTSYEPMFGYADFGNQGYNDMATNLVGLEHVEGTNTLTVGHGQAQSLGDGVYADQVSDMSLFYGNGYIGNELAFAMPENVVSPEGNAYMHTLEHPFRPPDWQTYMGSLADITYPDIGLMNGSDYLQQGGEANAPADHGTIESNTGLVPGQAVIGDNFTAHYTGSVRDGSVQSDTVVVKDEQDEELAVSVTPACESEYEDSDGDERRPSKAPKLNKDGVPRKPRQPRPKLLKWNDNDWKNVALGIVWACGENGIQIPFEQASQVVGESCTAGALQQALLKLRGRQIADGHDIPPLKMAWTRKPKNSTPSTPNADSRSSQITTPSKTPGNKKKPARKIGTPSKIVVLRSNPIITPSGSQGVPSQVSAPANLPTPPNSNPGVGFQVMTPLISAPATPRSAQQIHRRSPGCLTIHRDVNTEVPADYNFDEDYKVDYHLSKQPSSFEVDDSALNDWTDLFSAPTRLGRAAQQGRAAQSPSWSMAEAFAEVHDADAAAAEASASSSGSADDFINAFVNDSADPFV
jgi:hypothetical protein